MHQNCESAAESQGFGVQLVTGAALHALFSQPYGHVVLLSEQSVFTSLSVLLSMQYGLSAVHVVLQSPPEHP